MQVIFLFPLALFGLQCIDYSESRNGTSRIIDCNANKSKLSRRSDSALHGQVTTHSSSKLQITVDCRGKICEKVYEATKLVSKFITNTISFREPVRVHVKFYSFCQTSPCLKPEIAGNGMPSKSVLTKDESGIKRGFPQALYKEKGFREHVDFNPFDILINLNSDMKFHFPQDFSREKRPEEVSFTELLIHEVSHGLGMASSVSDYGAGHPTPTPSGNNPIEFYESYFDKFLYVGKTQLSVYTSNLNTFSKGKMNSQKDISSYSKRDQIRNFYTIASTPGCLEFVTSRRTRITLDTTERSPRGAKISGHLDFKDMKTQDFMMVKDSRGSRKFDSFFEKGKSRTAAPYGPKTLSILETLGYRVNRNPSMKNSLLKYYYDSITTNSRKK